VWLEFNSKRQQNDIGSSSSVEQKWSLRHRLLWTARISFKLFIETRVRMDSEGATSSKANNSFFHFDRLRLEVDSKRALHLYLQEG